jgi:PAS domain S-box-containing protein
MMDKIPVKEDAGGQHGSHSTLPRGKKDPARLTGRAASTIPLNLTREQALRQLETFHALTHMLADCNNDVTRIAECAVRVAAQTLGDLCGVLLLEGRRNTYRLAAFHDEDPEALALFQAVVDEAAGMPPDQGIAAQVMTTGEPLFIPHLPVAELEGVPLPVFQDYLHRVGFGSVIIVPLLSRSGALGALAISRHGGARAYTGTDQHFLEQIAFSAGRAIEAAHLVSTLRREVSARLLATHALAASEQRFLSIFHASPLGITVMDLEGTMLETNAAFQALSGFTESDLMAMRFQDLTQAEDVHRVLDIFERLNAAREPQAHMEHRIVKRDGDAVWVKTTFAGGRKPPADTEPDLIFGITEDFSDRKRSEAELLELKQHLQASIEMERLHLAQNLHDRPLQELYAVIYRLEEMRLGADRDNSRVLAEIIDDIRKTLNALRSTATELRPPALSRFGFEKAARSYMQEFHDKNPGIQVELSLAQDRQSLPETVRLVLFRVLQEAVANVARHAQASEVQVRFTFDAEEARLEVSDNGKGFAVPDNWMSVVREGHYGLAGMSERVTAAGGLLSVESAPGVHATIRVSIPCGIG